MTDESKRQLEEVLKCVPGYDPWSQTGDAYLDHVAAIAAINFFHDRLKHVEGSARGSRFTLRRWQAAVVGNLFGWKRVDEAGRIVRRYRKSLLMIPRGNGKTPLAAGIVLYGFYEDHEPGAQCFLAAGKRTQAGILFRNAKGMLDQDAGLKDLVTIYAGDQHRSIVLKDDPLSFCKVIPADAAGEHGGIPHITVVDELHVQESHDLLDVFETAMSKKVRSQPLLVMITTSDYDRESVCNEQYDYACKVRDNGGDPEKPGFDPSFFPVIYEAGPDDDWNDEETWAKANPNLGVSVSLESLRKTYRKAVEQPRFENTFKRLHLNIKTRSDVRWLSMGLWDKCADPIDEQSLVGRPCCGGMDLSTKLDITAFVLAFHPTPEDLKWRLLCRFWVPEKNAEKREHKDKVPYLTWARRELVTTTPDSWIDFTIVQRDVLALCNKYHPIDVGYDGWSAQHMAQQLGGEGVRMFEFNQGFKSMSEPSKEFEKLIVAGRLAHGGNPVLRWMAGNCAVETDAAGNIKPSKKKSPERIDGIVASIMAVGRGMLAPADPLSKWDGKLL